MPKRAAPRGGGRPCADALEVFRVACGHTWFVWLYSYNACGCYTHWIDGRSRYCDPAGCRYKCRTEERYWKSYAAAGVFDPDRELYIPVVLEITERLELDLRGVAKRGQRWKLSRAPQDGPSEKPIRGVLDGERLPSETPMAFDVLPVVRRLYHVEALALTQACPLPSIIRVEAHQGDKPDGYLTAEQEREQQVQRLSERSAASRNARSTSGPRYY